MPRITTVADVMAQALIVIDDVRMQKELASNPALFYRRYSAYVEAAMTLITMPPQLYEYISNGYTKPTYDDYSWVSDASSTESETVINTGKIGYELCCASVRYKDDTYYEPYKDFTYNDETGDITMPVQEEEGIEYEFDFYRDGQFEALTSRMERLLALATAIIWDERFSRNWLNMQPKLKDASFETINEANYMDKLTARMQQNRQNFSDELRKYEQDFAYRQTVGGLQPTTVFI